VDVQAGLVINPFLLLPCEGEPEVSAHIRGHKISVASLYKNEDATITVNLLVDGKMGCHEEVAALAVDEVLPLIRRAAMQYRPPVLGSRLNAEGQLAFGFHRDRR